MVRQNNAHRARARNHAGFQNDSKPTRIRFTEAKAFKNNFETQHDSLPAPAPGDHCSLSDRCQF
eukprot:6031092-Pyramimonas_sp.AAC.1